MMDLENREKEGEKDYEDKKTYCCGFNGTYATGTYARNQYTGNITWVTKTKATCTNRGLKYKKCKSCGKKWTDVIRRTPALGHKPGKVKILKPGCTSVGYKTTNCTRKGCMNSYGGAEDGYLTVETIPALGHSYDKGTSIKIGKKRGGKMQYQKTQKCKRCGKRKISYYYK